MERKLSQKAASLRRRFIFTRNIHQRDRASTTAAPGPRTGKSSSSRRIPRSATSPVATSMADKTSDEESRSRYYNFTDEPGYFRPASPLLHRQDISDDLEAGIKYACTLLTHSIERGMPTWLSFQTDLELCPERRVLDTTKEPSLDISEESPLDQDPFFSQKQDEAQRVFHKGKHDSGVAFSIKSPGPCGRVYRTSLSGGTGSSRISNNNFRFYGQRYSSLSQPQQYESLHRGRHSRNHSLNSDTPSQRSRSSSPMLSPYSPPQLDLQWQSTQTVLGKVVVEKEVEYSNNNKDPEVLVKQEGQEEEEMADTALGPEGLSWLHAIISQEDNGDTPASPKSHFSSLASHTRLEISPRPPMTRFYNPRCQSSASNSSSSRRYSVTDHDTWRCSHPVSADIHRYESRRSFSLEAEVQEEEKEGGYPANADMPVHHLWATFRSSSQNNILKQQQTAKYSVIIPDAAQQSHHRRRRAASQLLRKLTGHGR